MSDKNHIIELNESEINTIRDALSYLQELKYNDDSIQLDDNLTPYYYDNKGDKVYDNNDKFIITYNNIDSIYSKTWKVVRLNNN